MKIITAEQIESLHIAPAECVEWVKDAFLLKNRCQLPAKISVHPAGNDFFTTMPCLLPDDCHRFGVKVVSRILGRKPALKSDLMLFDSSNGELLALVDCDWITAMRTGAVATLAIRTFRSARAKTYAFVGLGSTARATLSCLLATSGHEQLRIRLFRYKDQAEKTIESFASYPDVAFETVDSMAQLADGADVLVSCITDAAGLLVEDDSLFKPGVLVVPVHTRGFQNCDLCFDKVFADDTDHVRGFRYFQQFRQFHEFSEVLSGTCRGRESDTERILSYNIGLGLHDVYFANRIYRLLYPQCNL
ncbi:MAG TPA: ornithine cyclodeaminase [Alistipes sp.]|uniref:ornithine cyclodeaminase n=1 Tax=Alistipes sp. TaxID=1872444 RepID=UPI000E8668C3|nr:ornithine cyclodeaminase [Alistipes sp.]HAW65115.1 ornithine cyclodeaminase [Alistipes sp.]HJC75940.1 ornithine cyclodeaminase [Candidatus Alistipes excrementavium]